MKFGPFVNGSPEHRAIIGLLTTPEIWEPQRSDGLSIEDAAGATFFHWMTAVFYEGEEPIGYVLFQPVGADRTVFAQHTAFLEANRGKDAIGMMKEARDAMFLRTACTHIITDCPDWHRGAESAAKLMGATKMFRRPYIAHRDGQPFGGTVYGMTALEWAWAVHAGYAEIGHRWHEEVFASLAPHHDDDATHDGFVGLAVEMSRHQPHKAVAVYNAWAKLAGYAAGTLIWADGRGHAIIDIGDAVVVNTPDRVVAAFPTCPPSQPSEQS